MARKKASTEAASTTKVRRKTTSKRKRKKRAPGETSLDKPKTKAETAAMKVEFAEKWTKYAEVRGEIKRIRETLGLNEKEESATALWEELTDLAFAMGYSKTTDLMTELGFRYSFTEAAIKDLTPTLEAVQTSLGEGEVVSGRNGSKAAKPVSKTKQIVPPEDFDPEDAGYELEYEEDEEEEDEEYEYDDDWEDDDDVVFTDD